MKELVADHKSFDGLVKNITIFYGQNFFKVSSKEQHREIDALSCHAMIPGL